MIAEQWDGAPRPAFTMHKKLVLGTLLSAMCLPTGAHAGAVVIGNGVAWKPMPTASTGIGNGGAWDNRSYDSASNQGGTGTGLCSAGSLVLGETCDWVERTLQNPLSASVDSPVEYLALDGPPVENQGDFFLRGDLSVDLNMLFQLTNWDGARLDTPAHDGSIEFGWYRAGDPTQLFPLFGPGGPFTDNDGSVAVQGQASFTITGDFGFYYRSTMFGSDAASEVAFFTESRFNKIPGYSAYFDFAEFDNQGRFSSEFKFDDEIVRLQYDVALFSGNQQFALFRQGNRYWLGIEDQVGAQTSIFCAELDKQPCSDYDFNDFIVEFDVETETVPEPTTLTLLAGALFAAAWTQRRRR